jgi:L-2,4-diaminobutyrate decarboxylase
MKNLLTKAYAADDFRRFGHQLIDLLSDHLKTVQTAETPQTINWESPGNQLGFWKDDFNKPLIDGPDTLFRDILSHSIHLHSCGAMGHQVSPPAPAAILAAFLSSFLNNGLAVYEMGMAGNAIEKVVTSHLAKKFGFDEKASGLVTSGGTLGNLTALLAARASATTVWNDGNLPGQQLAVMVSEEAHYSVDRAVRIMGLGGDGTIKVPANEKFQMRCELLDDLLNEAKQQGKKVFCIIGSACSTSTGAYDDLEAIAAFAEKHQIWFHTDGAHGAPAVYSPKYKHLLNGISCADSITIDFHKMMLTPALSTALIFKRGSDAYHTFSQKAQYLWERQDTGEWYNSGKVTFECTKTMNVISAYTFNAPVWR